ncbi:hypothetical protein RPO_02715 [Rickettsia rickettsii str. Arizona]|uniref:Uncharacterized protein n=2 Tax=spotted fever group TaxID=114277 RepID=A0A0H3AX48_RICRS|nr:hypothetical protein A1G_02725 [Rickettsia rickettsii str. 'Sheila Smith']AFB22336.1 hypothetical protein RPN_04195 [Rickettsia rickettsii str. Brazil]AFB23429.1 hypothetical protein RPL_02700 [Rickettsia rickettsii str. Colombia]AFB24780.1 hypothetical protein RPO_02715 [Rickettsia rickettsii str. Arizona]AFB26113.1 hypothetical protein RSA_02665 [Rickettsia philipii str. 364D]AFB27465.1 hypothetical protein RPJ_02695 [Rickettsia rickettsii str. Hino]AFB28988.1 hypothetical protein RPK_03
MLRNKFSIEERSKPKVYLRFTINIIYIFLLSGLEFFIEIGTVSYPPSQNG